MCMQKNKKLHILHVVASMNRGGAETFVMNILRAIDRDNYRFYFLCFSNNHFDYEDEIEQLGGIIVRIPDIKDVGIIAYIRAIKSVIKKYQIDIVHAHTYYNSVFALIAAARAGVSMRIAHSHCTQSEVSPPLKKRIYFTLARFAISRYATEKIACAKDAGRALFGRRPFTVINNGIDLQKFAYSETIRRDIREAYNLPQDATILLNVARFYEVKNHNFIIDIFAQYHKEQPKSYLLLVGDGPLRAAVEAKVAQLGLSRYVIFTGVVADTEKMYSAADVFVMPSFFEGLPVVLIEAQANRLPCVVSDTIDSDVKMSTRMTFASLGHGADSWVSEVSRAVRKGRADVVADELRYQYDINHITNQLVNIYKGVLDG